MTAMQSMPSNPILHRGGGGRRPEVGEKQQHCLPQMRIALPFIAQITGAAVAGQECYIVAQGQDLILDGLDQVGVIAAAQIGAADGTFEQHITHEGKALGFVEKHHRSR